MAYFRIEYYSKALRRETSFEVLIPNDPREDTPEPAEGEPMKTLFLLHGYTGKAGNYVPNELPGQYNFAIVMPTAENSFYLNGKATGRAYQTMLGEELVDYVRQPKTLTLWAFLWAALEQSIRDWPIRNASARSVRCHQP